MKSRAWLIAGLASTTLACSIFGGFDGFSGGDDDPALDASSDPAVLPEGAVAEDAASDASADADGKADFCTPDATFCDTFERTILKGLWDNTTESIASLSLDTTRSASPITSVKVTIPTTDAGGTRAQLGRTFAGSTQRVSLAFAVSLDALPSRAVQLPNVSFDHGGGIRRFVMFQLEPTGLVINEQELLNGALVASASLATIGSLPLSGWRRIVADVDLTTRRLTVKIDGASVLDKTLSLAFAPAPAIVIVGTPYATAGPAFNYWIDDVRVDITP